MDSHGRADIAPLRWAGVMPEQLDEVWPKVAPMLQRAVARGPSEFDLSHVREGLIREMYQLWILGREPGALTGALVTSVNNCPLKRILTIVLAAGSNADEWIEHIDVLDAFARVQECDEIRIWGRRGWERKLKASGFRHEYSILTREIATRH